MHAGTPISGELEVQGVLYEYLRVRLERERQLQELLPLAQPVSVSSMVNSLYGDRIGFTSEMRWAAETTCSASLVRLSRLGLVQKHGLLWTRSS